MKPPAAYEIPLPGTVNGTIRMLSNALHQFIDFFFEGTTP
jgi:hypothetical protein